MRQTIFTPTYNRANTLPRLYESIKSQQFKDFCWLIIDDGSRDETYALVKSWLKRDETKTIENGFCGLYRHYRRA